MPPKPTCTPLFQQTSQPPLTLGPCEGDGGGGGGGGGGMNVGGAAGRLGEFCVPRSVPKLALQGTASEA